MRAIAIFITGGSRMPQNIHGVLRNAAPLKPGSHTQFENLPLHGRARVLDN